MKEWPEWNEILNRYTEDVRIVEKTKKITDGLFGMGRAPSEAPCHEEMDRRTEELTGRAAAEADAESIGGLVNAIFRAAVDYQGPEYARIALVAAQRHAMPLIGSMTETDREALRVWYEKAYPRRRRFPMQTEILRLLGGR